MTPEQIQDISRASQLGILTGAAIPTLGATAYTYYKLATPEQKAKMDETHRAWKKEIRTPKGLLQSSLLGPIAPLKTQKPAVDSFRDVASDEGINIDAIPWVGGLAGGTIAGGIAARKAGLFNYMDGRVFHG